MLSQSINVLAVLAPALSYAALVQRDLTPVASPAANPPAPGWTYSGCYTDSPTARKLDSTSYTRSDMTVEYCVSFCSSQGYTVAGLEYSTECYCGFNLKAGSSQASESKCQYACGGNASEPCGGAPYLSVYSNGGTGGVAKPTVNGYSYIGCYTDSSTNRALTYVAHDTTSSQYMSQELCTSLCSKRGYKYAGLEFRLECFCGNDLGDSAQLVQGTPQDTGCDYLCQGDKSEWCGGKDRLTLYSNAATLPSEQLYCPGFEGGCGWSAATISPYWVGYYDTSLPHSGDYYAKGYGRSCSSGCSSPATGCIETTTTVPAGAYRLSFSLGRIDNFQQDPRCAPNCAPPAYSVNYTVSLNGTNYSGPVCSGGCNSTDVAGAAVYNTYKYRIKALEGYQDLKLCVTWDGIRSGKDDFLLTDDFSIYGPY